MSTTYPAVKKVVSTDDYKLILTFSNGETRIFDMEPYLDKGIFRELRKLTMFHTVHVSFDTIEWDNEADFDPEVLYKLGKKTKDKKYTSATRQSFSAAETNSKYRKK